ncbi:MAG: GNAT family N-acetyltransferase [archaeon]
MPILRANEYDIPDILPLILEYFPYTKMEYDRIEQRIQRKDFLFLKSETNGVFTGFAEYQITNPKRKIVRLNGIVVTRAHRGKGIAKALMEEGEKWARRKKMKTLFLLVQSTNARAQKVYAENGFLFKKIHSRKIDGKKAEVWEKSLDQ